MAERKKLVEAQQQDLDFDWYSPRAEDIEKRMAVADTVYQLVTDTLNTVNPLPMLFESATGELGKKIRDYRTYGGRVYERTYGEYKKASPFKREYFTISTSPKTLHWEWPVEDIQAGAVTLPEIAEMSARAILFYKVKLAWDTMKAAVPTTGAYSTDVGASLTQSSLDTVIRAAGDQFEIAGIIGRHVFVSNITTYSGYDHSTGFPESVKEELHRRGMQSIYRGIPVFPLMDMQDELANQSAMDSTTAFIVARNKSFNRYVEVTPLKSVSEVRPSDGTFHLYYDFEDGFALWKPKYVRRLNGA